MGELLHVRVYAFLIVLFHETSRVGCYSVKDSRCFDCFYSPSGYVWDDEGIKEYVPVHSGSQKCSMKSTGDDWFISKSFCDSGICFLRLDHNGLLYRGCADKPNLPWGIDTSKQCQSQGLKDSIWWFCEGDLCNGGNFEDEEHCGAGFKDFIFGNFHNGYEDEVPLRNTLHRDIKEGDEHGNKKEIEPYIPDETVHGIELMSENNHAERSVQEKETKYYGVHDGKSHEKSHVLNQHFINQNTPSEYKTHKYQGTKPKSLHSKEQYGDNHIMNKKTSSQHRTHGYDGSKPKTFHSEIQYEGNPGIHVKNNMGYEQPKGAPMQHTKSHVGYQSNNKNEPTYEKYHVTPEYNGKSFHSNENGVKNHGDNDASFDNDIDIPIPTSSALGGNEHHYPIDFNSYKPGTTSKLTHQLDEPKQQYQDYPNPKENNGYGKSIQKDLHQEPSHVKSPQPKSDYHQNNDQQKTLHDQELLNYHPKLHKPPNKKSIQSRDYYAIQQTSTKSGYAQNSNNDKKSHRETINQAIDKTNEKEPSDGVSAWKPKEVQTWLTLSRSKSNSGRNLKTDKKGPDTGKSHDFHKSTGKKGNTKSVASDHQAKEINSNIFSDYPINEKNLKLGVNYPRNKFHKYRYSGKENSQQSQYRDVSSLNLRQRPPYTKSETFDNKKSSSKIIQHAPYNSKYYDTTAGSKKSFQSYYDSSGKKSHNDQGYAPNYGNYHKDEISPFDAKSLPDYKQDTEPEIINPPGATIHFKRYPSENNIDTAETDNEHNQRTSQPLASVTYPWQYNPEYYAIEDEEYDAIGRHYEGDGLPLDELPVHRRAVPSEKPVFLETYHGRDDSFLRRPYDISRNFHNRFEENEGPVHHTDQYADPYTQEYDKFNYDDRKGDVNGYHNQNFGNPWYIGNNGYNDEYNDREYDMNGFNENNGPEQHQIPSIFQPRFFGSDERNDIKENQDHNYDQDEHGAKFKIIKPFIEKEGESSSAMESNADPYTPTNAEVYEYERHDYDYNYGNLPEENTEKEIDHLDGYNPCSGTCGDNPSALYPDPKSARRFIQCGSGIVAGRPCICCKPFSRDCPDGTAFDKHQNVCSELSDIGSSDYKDIDLK